MRELSMQGELQKFLSNRRGHGSSPLKQEDFIEEFGRNYFAEKVEIVANKRICGKTLFQ